MKKITTFWLTTLLSTALLSANSYANDADFELFFTNLSSVCGATYVGEMTYPEDGQDSFKGKELVAEIAACTPKTISIPFHVGENKTRTWHISRQATGLSLKHEHRHQDGSLDKVTDYGGSTFQSNAVTSKRGTPLKQSFPADQYTQELIPAAATNVWNLELSDDKSILTYHLERHQAPRFTAVLKRVTKEDK